MKEKSDINILFIVPRYEPTIYKKNYKYTFPMGLGYIIAFIKKAGYFLDVINLNHEEGSIEENIKKVLDKKKYDFVMTGNTGLGCIVTEIIIKAVKEHPTSPKFVLGGSLITGEPKVIFKDLQIDFGIIDEGEETIIELLDHYRKNKDYSNIKGLAYRDSRGECKFNEDRLPIMDLDSIPFPDFESMGYREYLDNSTPDFFYVYSAFDKPRVYYLIGSRSCPYQCTFCWHYNKKVRFRSIDNIMKEIKERVKKYRINRVYMFDECFAINKERAIEFAKRMKEFIKTLEWDLKWLISLRVNIIDEELLKILRECGCDTISYGLESYSPIVLNSMKKMITPEQIDFAIKKAMENKISIQGNFIFGDTAETYQTAQETLNYWKKNCKGQLHLDFIMPYPNSEIYQNCIKKGIIKNRLKFIRNIVFFEGNPINMTDSMTDKEFEQLKKDIFHALGKYRKIAVPISIKNEGNKRYALKVICPFCKAVITYGNYPIEKKFSYSSTVACRECKMRFYVASPFRKFLLNHFEKAKSIRDIKIKIEDYITKLKL